MTIPNQDLDRGNPAEAVTPHQDLGDDSTFNKAGN